MSYKYRKEAISQLVNNQASFSIDRETGEIVMWSSAVEKPSEEDIVLKETELQYQDEVNEYQRQRAREYPPVIEQQDMKFHDDVNGTTVWRDTIQAIKDKYPKQTMDADELQGRKDQAIFDLQTERYLKATKRLSQYILLEGREEITEEKQDPVLDEKGLPTFDDEGNQIMSDVTETVITQTAIEPLEEFVEVTEFDPETMELTTETIRNPLVVKDEEERASAQAVVDATPQAVIDAINT